MVFDGDQLFMKLLISLYYQLHLSLSGRGRIRIFQNLYVRRTTCAANITSRSTRGKHLTNVNVLCMLTTELEHTPHQVSSLGLPPNKGLKRYNALPILRRLSRRTTDVAGERPVVCLTKVRCKKCVFMSKSYNC